WETAAGWEPRWVVEVNQPSSKSVSHAGFSWPLIAAVPAQGATLRAWAIDLERNRAYALDGAIKLAP
ncbi:MAG TPA: hypothetical protein VE086_06745, partial [Chthoniobacterales bacterium]|nr:hypothetical protein [Chthoniobacterales bacterium]